MDWFDRIPKVELHVHLEGAVPPAALWRLAGKYGDAAAAHEAAVRRMLRVRDTREFFRAWDWKNRLIRSTDDFAFAAEAAARALAAQNVRYAEAFYSPADHALRGLEVEPLTEALRAGLARVPAVEVALVADLVRDVGPRRGAAMLERVAALRGLGVIGIGIGGKEHAWPPEPWAPVFARARALGLRTTAHAGEMAGARSVWGAVRRLGTDRVGHATRAAEDERLLDWLAAHRTPLELCPISNLRLGIVASLAEHPVRRYFDRGLHVTVNTDDPGLFGTTLADEYRALVAVHGFTRDEVRRLVLAAADACWLPEPRKARLRDALAADPAWAAAPAAGAA